MQDDESCCHLVARSRQYAYTFYSVDAIDAARQSNADELNRLRQKLDKINENIDFQENKHKTLEQENSVLQ